MFEFAKLHALSAWLTHIHVFAPYTTYVPFCLRSLHAFVHYVLSRFTCLDLTRLFGYAAYYKFAFKCDKAFYSRQYENVLKGNKQWSFISSSFNFLKISYFNGSVSSIIIFITIIVDINLFQFC